MSVNDVCGRVFELFKNLLSDVMICVLKIKSLQVGCVTASLPQFCFPEVEPFWR